MYERRLKGETIPSISKRFNINKSNTEYIIALIRKHGYSIINKKIKYTKKFKLDAINRVLNNGESLNSVSIDIGLCSSSTLRRWVLNFKKNGYNIEKKKDRK